TGPHTEAAIARPDDADLHACLMVTFLPQGSPRQGKRDSSTSHVHRPNPGIIRCHMHFGLDLRSSLARPTGVGSYVLAMARRLPALAPADHFYFFSASF